MMELKQYERTSAWELNHTILPKLNHSKFPNIKSLCEELNIKPDNYTWYGEHKRGGKSMLIAESSLQNIRSIQVLSRDIGG